MTSKFKISVLKLLLVIFSVSALFFISGCKKKEDDPKPSKQDEVTSVLTSATWKVSSVTVDGVDKTELYAGLTLRFTPTNYTSTNGVPVWPATGAWSFTTEEANAFQRSDGVLVEIIEVTATSLKLKLDWDETTLGSGRVGSVEGDHVFSFVK
ncbi:MAG: hypothetical protein KF763_15720 [Cyclobacteriaceae bacterium]|nr:hypothetical protein [Cyclobacteriaceae bacterium]